MCSLKRSLKQGPLHRCFEAESAIYNLPGIHVGLNSFRRLMSRLETSIHIHLPSSLILAPPGPALPLAGRLEAPSAGHSDGQRPGLQCLPTEGRPERKPAGGLRGQDAQQSPADQHNAQVCVEC